MNTLTKKSTNLFGRTVSIVRHSTRLSHDERKPRKWAKWQDVPDDWILPSKRMPDNPFYQTEDWKNFKKKQIFYQQDDGIPVYLKRGYPYNYIYWLLGAMFVISFYGAITGMLDGHIYPKKK